MLKLFLFEKIYQETLIYFLSIADFEYLNKKAPVRDVYKKTTTDCEQKAVVCCSMFFF